MAPAARRCATTPMPAGWNEDPADMRTWLDRFVPLRRHAAPEDIALVIAFPVSDDRRTSRARCSCSTAAWPSCDALARRVELCRAGLVSPNYETFAGTSQERRPSGGFGGLVAIENPWCFELQRSSASPRRATSGAVLGIGRGPYRPLEPGWRRLVVQDHVASPSPALRKRRRRRPRHLPLVHPERLARPNRCTSVDGESDTLRHLRAGPAGAADSPETR